MIEDNGVDTPAALLGPRAPWRLRPDAVRGLAMQLGRRGRIVAARRRRHADRRHLPDAAGATGRRCLARGAPHARPGLVVGLTIAVLVAAGALLTIVHSNSAAKQQRLVVSNYETISLMRQALIALQDAEIGQRAYLLTGDVANLEPYERARLRIEPIVRQLEAASADDPEARARSPSSASPRREARRTERDHRRLSSSTASDAVAAARTPAAPPPIISARSPMPSSKASG